MALKLKESMLLPMYYLNKRVLINNFRTELKESMLLLLHYLNRLVLDDILDIQIRRTNATVTCGSMSKGYS